MSLTSFKAAVASDDCAFSELPAPLLEEEERAALHALVVDLEGQGLDLLLHVVGEQVAEGHGCSEVLRCIRE